MKNRNKYAFILFCLVFCQILEINAKQIILKAQKEDSAKEQVKESQLMNITLEQAFDMASKNNKSLPIAQYDIAIAKSNITIAKAIMNPRFNLQYGFGPAFTLILAGNPQQFGWQFDIPLLGKRTKNINLANANYDLAVLKYQQQLFSVHNQVRRAYSELISAEAYNNLIDAQIKTAQILNGIAVKRFQAGEVSMNEVLLAQLGVNQLQIQKQQANLRLKQASSNLAYLLGINQKKVLTIDPDNNSLFSLKNEKSSIAPNPKQELPSLDVLLGLQNQNSDLKVLIQQAQADKIAIPVARCKVVPDLLVESGYQFTTFLKHQPYNLYPYNVPNSPGAYLNFQWEIPIWYQYQGELAKAKKTFSQDIDQVDQEKYTIVKNILNAYNNVRLARANVIKYQIEILPLAKQVTTLSFKGYRVGKNNLSDAIIARQQYQQNLSNYFDSVVSYQNSWADLEMAVGVSLNLN